MKMKTLIAAVAFLGLAAVAHGAALDKDTLVIGTESTFKPFEFRNEQNEVVGFDMDLAALVAEKLGKKLEIVDMAFDALIPSVIGGKIDLAVAGISSTPERARVVAFSETYYVTPDAFVVKKGVADVTSLDSLKGKTVAVQLGTTQDIFVSGLEGVTVRRYQKTDDAFRDVQAGRVNVACVDGTVTEDMLANNKDFTDSLNIAFLHRTTEEGFAFAVSKKDPELLAKVNAALAEILASPAFDELKAKWAIQ